MLVHALSFALLLTPDAAPADDAPASPAAPAAPGEPAPSPPAKPDDRDRVVCRWETQVGSNRRTRICMTVREREELQDRARQQVLNAPGSGFGDRRGTER